MLAIVSGFFIGRFILSYNHYTSPDTHWTFFCNISVTYWQQG